MKSASVCSLTCDAHKYTGDRSKITAYIGQVLRKLVWKRLRVPFLSLKESYPSFSRKISSPLIFFQKMSPFWSEPILPGLKVVPVKFARSPISGQRIFKVQKREKTPKNQRISLHPIYIQITRQEYEKIKIRDLVFWLKRLLSVQIYSEAREKNTRAVFWLRDGSFLSPDKFSDLFQTPYRFSENVQPPLNFAEKFSDPLIHFSLVFWHKLVQRVDRFFYLFLLLLTFTDFLRWKRYWFPWPNLWNGYHFSKLFLTQ